MRDFETYLFFLFSSSVSRIFFFSTVGFARERSAGDDGRSRCLRLGERERERLLPFRLGDLDLLLLLCLCFFLSLPGMLVLRVEEVSDQ